MLRRGNTETLPPPNAGTVRQAEERIYVQIEECRIRCERLAEAGYPSPSLREAHRLVGLAGYHMSTWMAPAARHHGQTQAHHQAASATVPDAQEMIDTLTLRVDHALDALDECLENLSDEEYLHVAQLHMITARQVLAGPVLPWRLGTARYG